MTISIRVLLVLILLTCLVVATVYTYWTRTPQYALLHALTSEGALMSLAPQTPRNQALRIRREREPLTKYLATLQNRVLANAYGIHVQHVDEEGHTAILSLNVNNRRYALTLSEEPDGGWHLEDVPARADLARDVAAARRPHPLLFLARL